MDSIQINHLALPPETQAIHLIESYFVSPGTMFPFIPKSQVISTYKQARDRRSAGVPRSCLALLNAIFANATYLNAIQRPRFSRQQDISESETFFMRAEVLLSPIDPRVHNLESGMLHPAALGDLRR